MGPRTRTLVALGLCSFVLYAELVPRAVGWLDAPELLTAGFNLAQPHPPGHPAFVQALKGFLLLPAGDVALRGNLFSGAFAAVVVALVAALAGRLAARTGAPRWAIEAAAVSAGVGLATSGSVAIQALSVEVYTLNAALVLGAFVMAVSRPGDGRVAVPICVLLALGLANHHLLTLLAVPAVGVAWLRRGSWRAAAAGGALGLVVVAGAYAFLAARSAAGAWPAWADASGLRGLLWVASARVFAGSVGGFDGGGVTGNALKALELVAWDLSPAALPLAAAGTLAAARRGGLVPAVAAVLLVAGSLASKVMMGILDPENPDDHGYFLVAVAGTAALAGAGAAWLAGVAARARTSPHRVVALAGAVGSFAMLSALPPATGVDVLAERSASPDTPLVRGLVLEGQPPRAVLLLSHYPVFFLATEASVVEGARPDVTAVQQGFSGKAMGGAAYASRVARDDPDIAPLATAFLSTGSLDWKEVVGLARARPVRIEADPAVQAPVADLRYAGWMFEVVPGGARPDPAGAEAVARGHVAALRRAVPSWPRPGIETRRVLLRNLAASADWLERRGERAASAVLIDAATELNPADATVRRMREAGSRP